METIDYMMIGLVSVGGVMLLYVAYQALVHKRLIYQNIFRKGIFHSEVAPTWLAYFEGILALGIGIFFLYVSIKIVIKLFSGEL